MKQGNVVAEKNDSVEHFVAAAAAFCQVVEGYPRYGTESQRWLADLGPILQRLDTTINALRLSAGEADYSMLQDLEERFVLFQQLKSFLGAYDEYWSEGDLEASDGLKTGSLADDITDMYFDLRRGLTLYRSGPEAANQAVDLWLHSYRVHWQQHLQDATKQLFEFRRAG